MLGPLSWLFSPDIIIAVANLGLAAVFYPLVVRNQRRRYCHIPLTTSVPKALLLVLLCVGLVAANLPMAAAVCWLDIICWLILIGQRIRLGSGEHEGRPVTALAPRR